MKKVLLMIFIQTLLVSNFTYAKWDKMLTDYLHTFKEEKLDNQSLLGIWYGISKPNNDLLMNNQVFSDGYNLGIEYGFIRYKESKELGSFKLNYGERMFVENSSSHLKPSTIAINGETYDTWTFGLSAIDGVGVKFGDNSIDFAHQSAFIWAHIDFENYDRHNIVNAQIQNIDDKIKFGRMNTLQFNFNINNTINLGVQKRFSYVFQDYEFSDFAVSYLVEITAQKLIEFIDTQMNETFGKDYWLAKYVYKSLITLGLNELYKKNGYFPIKSKQPFYQNSYLIYISISGN